MMMGGLDARQFVHLPRWTKLLALVMLAGGLAASIVVIYLFFGETGSRDWVLIGISGGQFMLTTLVLTLILFFSQADANMATLRESAGQFLSETGALGIALGKVTPADGAPLTVKQGKRLDLFGYDYALVDAAGATVMRLWCGLNVNRFIVIYRFANPYPAGMSIDAFTARLRTIFAFSLGGAESVNYKAHYEPVPGTTDMVSVWLTVSTDQDLLTNPALKLFWSQDIAMMTESVLRTAQRVPHAVRLEVGSRPLPL